MAKYTIASLEGIDYARSKLGDVAVVDVGETVELKLTADQERALLAAGWLEEQTKPKEAKK
jgi:hypothetical protein